MWSWFGVGVVVLLLAGCVLGGALAAALDLPRAVGAFPGFVAAALTGRALARSLA